MEEKKKSLREKIADAKNYICDRKEEIWEWCKENKEVVMIGGTVIIGGAFDLVKSIIKSSEAQKEQSLRDDYIYDRSAGHYYRIKHIRSDRKRNRMYYEIDTRKRLGEPLNEILSDMKIMK